MKRSILILFCLTISIASGLGQSRESKPYKIFLLGGQSNMDGCGRSEDLPERYKDHPENVVTWDQNTKEWMPLGEDSFAQVRNFQFGPEVVFSHKLAKKFPDHTIAIIKTSAGGTTLYKHWVPGKNMYSRFLTKMNDGLQQLDQKNINYEVCGMLWMQGEGDTETIEMANAYESNLLLLIKDVRIKTGKPELPFVMGRISSSLLKETPWEFNFVEIVQKAQENVAAGDAHVHVINTNKLPTLKDNTHFNTKGQLSLGKNMAKAMISEIR